MKTIMQKLQSRKLWAAVAGIVTGLAMIFGLDQNIMSTVSGAVVAVSSVITYIIAEGRIDAEAVKAVIEAAEKAKEALGQSSVACGDRESSVSFADSSFQKEPLETL